MIAWAPASFSFYSHSATLDNLIFEAFRIMHMN